MNKQLILRALQQYKALADVAESSVAHFGHPYQDQARDIQTEIERFEPKLYSCDRCSIYVPVLYNAWPHSSVTVDAAKDYRRVEIHSVLELDKNICGQCLRAYVHGMLEVLQREV